MKKVAVILSVVSLSAMLVTEACNNTPGKSAPVTGSVATTGAPVGGAKIAYVNLDSLEAKYELLKNRRDDFKRRQEQMESELKSSYQKMEGDAQEVQKKAQANTLTQSEYESAQKRLYQMQQSLEARKQSLSEQLLKEQDEFNKDLKTRLDAFLENYNKSHNYDYILSYSYSGSPLLYVNKQLDITADVVNGMNSASKNADTKK